MKQRFDKPHFYNHVFYSSSSAGWKMTAFFIMGMAVSMAMVFLWNYIHPSAEMSLRVRTIAALLAFAFMIPILVFQIRNLKKIQIGVGSGGVYIRGYGLLTWAEIKKMELESHEKHGKVIKIITYHPEERANGAYLHSEKDTESAFSRLGESLNELFIVGGDFISIPLEELFSLLQEYHQVYQKEDKRHELCSRSGGGATINASRISLISSIFFKLGLMVAFALALALVFFLKGGITGLWVGLIVGAIASVLIELNVWHLVYEIIVFVISLVIIIVGVGLALYSLIAEGKMQWAAQGLVVFGILFLAIVVSRWRTRKKVREYNQRTKS